MKQGAIITAVVSLTVAIITAVVSLTVALISYRQSYYALDQTRQLTERQRDTDLLARFGEYLYASDGSRRYVFSVYIVDLMKDPGYRRGLRRLVFTEMMARNFSAPRPVTRFNKDRDDWRVAGDALWNLRRDWINEAEGQTFSDWWCDQKQMALERWPHHRKHLTELFGYLDDQHLSDRNFKAVHTPLGKILPCDLAKK